MAGESDKAIEILFNMNGDKNFFNENSFNALVQCYLKCE